MDVEIVKERGGKELSAWKDFEIANIENKFLQLRVHLATMQTIGPHAQYTVGAP